MVQYAHSHTLSHAIALQIQGLLSVTKRFFFSKCVIRLSLSLSLFYPDYLMIDNNMKNKKRKSFAGANYLTDLLLLHCAILCVCVRLFEHGRVREHTHTHCKNERGAYDEKANCKGSSSSSIDAIASNREYKKKKKGLQAHESFFLPLRQTKLICDSFKRKDNEEEPSARSSKEIQKNLIKERK